MGMDVLIQGIGDGNRIVLNRQGGVITVFGDADREKLFQETYQLEDKEARDLAQLLHKNGPRELMETIPAPLLVDLSVALTHGTISKGQFNNFKQAFEDDPRLMNGYRLAYEFTAKRSNGEFLEPKSGEYFEGKMAEALAFLEKRRFGVSHVNDFNQASGNEAVPVEVLQVESTHIPGVSVITY